MRNIDRGMTDANQPSCHPNRAVRIAMALFCCFFLLLGVSPFSGAEASVMYVSNEDGLIFQVGATGIVTPFATLSANSISPSLAFDGNGILYATEYVSNRISRINRNGQITPFATNIRSPDGLAFDQSGNLFTSTVLFGDVDKISPDGVVSTFATKMQLSGPGSLDYAPAGLAFGPDGNLYVAMSRNGKIMRIAPNGSVSLFVNLSPTIPAQPFNLTFDRFGNLFVIDMNSASILKVNSAGQVSTYTPRQARFYPKGLAFDENGTLFVSDLSQSQIDTVSPDGQTLTPFATGIINPTYIAFAPIPEPSLIHLLPFAPALLLRRRQRSLKISSN